MGEGVESEGPQYKVCSCCGKRWNVSIFWEKKWYTDGYLCPKCRERQKRYGMRSVQKKEAVPADAGDLQPEAGGADCDGAGDQERETEKNHDV